MQFIFRSFEKHTVVSRKMMIPKSLLNVNGLFYSYCLVTNGDTQHPEDEYFYDSWRWEGQKRMLSNRDELPGNET